MMYWVKFILFGVLAFAFSMNTHGKDTSYDNIINTSELVEECCFSEDSHLLSSDIFYAGRTLNYLLKTRRINASAAFCLSNTSSKDNQNNKFILPVINVQHNYTCMPRFITGRVFYINPHSRITYPKSYYIFTLGKIII